jgi:hypothetical protein
VMCGWQKLEKSCDGMRGGVLNKCRDEGETFMGEK